MAGPEVLKAKRGKGAEKKKRVYGTFKKKHLCSKKRSNRRVESKVPFNPSSGLHPSLLLV